MRFKRFITILNDFSRRFSLIFLMKAVHKEQVKISEEY